jgi:plastocyanin
MKGIRFSPATVTIRRGQTVTWKFDDGSIPHNVVATRFHSSSTKSSGTYTVRFTRAGTYSYVCTIHPGMQGKVVVH